MIKEQHRREILARRKIYRRYISLLDNAREDYLFIIKKAHKAGATPNELQKLTEYSLSRIKEILYTKEDE